MVDYVIFDLGGVLIDWNPRYLYRKLLPEAEVESFVQDVVPPWWHVQMDAGHPFAEAIAERLDEHPHHSSLIRAYVERWAEMLGGAIDGTVEILRALKGRGTPVYSLTNWSAETFHHAEARFEFLKWFEDILVSGRERLVKPDPAIYRRLLARNGLSPERGVFIDDVPKNLEGARAIGLDALHFTSPEALRADLGSRGLL